VCIFLYELSAVSGSHGPCRCHKMHMLWCISDDSCEMPAYSELMHDASLAIAQVQKALNSRPVTLQINCHIDFYGAVYFIYRIWIADH